MNESKICENCGKVFTRTPELRFKSCDSYWEKRRGCSRSCSHTIKFKYYPPYTRTNEHKRKMSDSHKKNDRVVSHGRKHFIEINKNKKGKTLEEIYGVERAGEIRKNNSRFGEKNANWRNGKSFIPYSHKFNIELKATIKKRDGFICRNCGIDEQTYKSKEVLGRGLTIHHIDYDKHNCLQNNLITLCKRCNSKANSNRGMWQEKFQNLLGV